MREKRKENKKGKRKAVISSQKTISQRYTRVTDLLILDFRPIHIFMISREPSTSTPNFSGSSSLISHFPPASFWSQPPSLEAAGFSYDPVYIGDSENTIAHANQTPCQGDWPVSRPIVSIFLEDLQGHGLAGCCAAVI